MLMYSVFQTMCNTHCYAMDMCIQKVLKSVMKFQPQSRDNFSAVNICVWPRWSWWCDSVLTGVYRADWPKVLTDRLTMERLHMRPGWCLHFADLAVCHGNFVYVIRNRLGVSLTVSGFGGLGVSVLASGTQVRGFKPGRSRRIFKGRKILSMPVKPWVPCRRFAACKRSLNCTVEVGIKAKLPVLIPRP
jgi:hypothetical protein